MEDRLKKVGWCRFEVCGPQGLCEALLVHDARGSTGLFDQSRVGAGGLIRLAVEAFMRRWRQKTTERAKGRISAIKSLDEKGNDDETKQALNSVEWQWCDYYEEYIGVKPLNIAVKRRRTENGAEDEDGGNQEDDKEKEGPKGGSKGGGKKAEEGRKDQRKDVGGVAEIIIRTIALIFTSHVRNGGT